MLMAVAKQESSECLTHAALPISDVAGFRSINVFEAVEMAPTHAHQRVLAVHSRPIVYAALAGVTKRPLRVDGVCRAHQK